MLPSLPRSLAVGFVLAIGPIALAAAKPPTPTQKPSVPAAAYPLGLPGSPASRASRRSRKPAGSGTRSTGSSWRVWSRSSSSTPPRPTDRPHPPGDVRPDRPAADARRGRVVPRATPVPTPTSGWSIDFSRRPQYGERWAQHWLDLAHYADSNGFELDAERPDAWRYRDWVVQALQRRHAL